MNLRQIWYPFLFVLLSTGIQAQTYSLSPTIKSLQAHLCGDWQQEPVLELGSAKQLCISFDELSHNYKRLAYRIQHCNRDGQPSDLMELEYLDGFSENDILDSERSYATHSLYTHYRLNIPNEQVQLKCSGNYRLWIYDRDAPETTLAEVFFRVSESAVFVSGTVTASTDVDYKARHQQLEVSVNSQGLALRQIENELFVHIQQNRRPDTERILSQPAQMQGQDLLYKHQRELIFEAVNEYRRFDISTYKHAGINVDYIQWHAPYYNAALIEAFPRNRNYVYDQDQNGRFYIHNIDQSNPEVDSEYFLVHFNLPMDMPYPDKGVYIYGDLVHNQLDERSKMQYNFERKAYEKTLLLKQGAYNYLYVTRQGAQGSGDPQLLEGSFWQTENEYQVAVYYRPIGSRYDRLVGFTRLRTDF